jgi:hypothetical protein
LASKPRSASAEAFWADFRPILFYSGWWLYGASSGGPRTYFPDGITILIGVDNGSVLNCASQLKDLLANELKISSVVLNVKETTPTLIECKNSCIEVVIGDLTIH